MQVRLVYDVEPHRLELHHELLAQHLFARHQGAICPKYVVHYQWYLGCRGATAGARPPVALVW
jgi:hypothetical protein